jgi:type II secretory pathway pseudopilin PulG
MKLSNNKAFTLLESTLVLFLTTIVIGATLGLNNLNKAYNNFKENAFLLEQDLKNSLSLATKGGEIPLTIENLTATHTICASGIMIVNDSPPYYYQIIYAPSSTNDLIDCSFDITYSTHTFDIYPYSPSSSIFYLTKTGGIYNQADDNSKKILKYVDIIKLATSSISSNEIDFNTTTIFFTNPWGKPFIYYSTNSQYYYLNFDNDAKLILIKNIRNNEREEILINKTGKISSQ